MRLLFLLFAVLTQVGASPQQAPIDTTLCKILDAPWEYNNRLVRVRGRIMANFEYFALYDGGCGKGIWLQYGDGSTPATLKVIVPGKAKPADTSRDGEAKPLIPIILIRDSNFESLQSYLKRKSELEGGHPCYHECWGDVTVTFIGRLDSVSKQVYDAHRKMGPNSKPDFRGFGTMGLFDAQLFIQSVADVIAEDLRPR